MAYSNEPKSSNLNELTDLSTYYNYDETKMIATERLYCLNLSITS